MYIHGYRILNHNQTVTYCCIQSAPFHIFIMRLCQPLNPSTSLTKHTPTFKSAKKSHSSHLRPTLFAIPKPSWLLRHTHTTPMEPFIWTLFVIARHHVARTHAAASAILAVISLALGILHVSIGSFFLAISIAKRAILPRIFGWGRFQVS